MDSSAQVVISHGISNFLKILRVDAMIIADGSVGMYPLDWNASGTPEGSIGFIDSTSIDLNRLTGGAFDSTNYDATSFNRGYVTIEYSL